VKTTPVVSTVKALSVINLVNMFAHACKQYTSQSLAKHENIY